MHEASVVHTWVRCFKFYLLTQDIPTKKDEIHMQSFGPTDVFLKDVQLYYTYL